MYTSELLTCVSCINVRHLLTTFTEGVSFHFEKKSYEASTSYMEFWWVFQLLWGGWNSSTLANIFVSVSQSSYVGTSDSFSGYPFKTIISSISFFSTDTILNKMVHVPLYHDAFSCSFRQLKRGWVLFSGKPTLYASCLAWVRFQHGGFTCWPISYHVSSYCGF